MGAFLSQTVRINEKTASGVTISGPPAFSKQSGEKMAKRQKRAFPCKCRKIWSFFGVFLPDGVETRRNRISERNGKYRHFGKRKPTNSYLGGYTLTEIADPSGALNVRRAGHYNKGNGFWGTGTLKKLGSEGALYRKRQTD